MNGIDLQSMRRLLLLPFLIGLLLPIQAAHSGEPAYDAYKRTRQHISNGVKFMRQKDYEMTCLEYSSANDIIAIYFNELNQSYLGEDWVKRRSMLKSFVEDFCT